MSERAFDKHVEFCEAYIAKAYEALTCLFELGPSEKVVRRTTDLAQVRRQFALWESADVSLFLAEFEAALRDASAAGDHSHGVAGADRAEHLTEVFASLRRVLPLEESSEGATPEMATLRTIEILQEHLGIAQLTRLRQHHLAESARRAESSQRMLEAP